MTCLSVCRRRQCPIERGDPLELERGDSVSTEAQKDRLGLFDMQLFQSAKQEVINANFKQLEPKKFSNEIHSFFKDNDYSKIW